MNGPHDNFLHAFQHLNMLQSGSGHSGNSRNSREPSRSSGRASSKQQVKRGRPNVTVHAVEQQAQEQSPEQPRSASNMQQLPDGSLLSENDQFVLADLKTLDEALRSPWMLQKVKELLEFDG